MSVPDVKRPLKSGNVSYQRRHSLFKKEIYNSAKTYRRGKYQHFGSLVFGNSHFDRCRHSPEKKIAVSFTTKYAVRRQIKPRILELSIRKRQSNLSSLISFSCEEKDYYPVVSVVQLGLTAARTASKAFVRVRQKRLKVQKKFLV